MEKPKTRSINITSTQSEKLKAIAFLHGCTYGNKGSISKLLQEIADGKLSVKPNYLEKE